MSSNASHSRVTIRPFRHRLAAVVQGRGRAVSASLVAILLAGLLASVPAHADNLDDQAKALQAQADDVESSLEFVDASLAKAAANLTLYRGQLPGAQQSLTDAQARVGTATTEVDGLAARVDLAQQNKDEITAQIETDSRRLADTKKIIGQIAAQSYKSGGVPSNLSLLFGSSSSGNLADTMDMAD